MRSTSGFGRQPTAHGGLLLAPSAASASVSPHARGRGHRRSRSATSVPDDLRTLPWSSARLSAATRLDYAREYDLLGQTPDCATSAELERENAHFSVTDTLISAMEMDRNVDLAVPDWPPPASSAPSPPRFAVRRNKPRTPPPSPAPATTNPASTTSINNASAATSTAPLLQRRSSTGDPAHSGLSAGSPSAPAAGSSASSSSPAHAALGGSPALAVEPPSRSRAASFASDISTASNPLLSGGSSTWSDNLSMTACTEDSSSPPPSAAGLDGASQHGAARHLTLTHFERHPTGDTLEVSREDRPGAHSAQALARSFLRSMGEPDELHPALQFLVSESEVPQDLLPMPVMSMRDLHHREMDDGWVELDFANSAGSHGGMAGAGAGGGGGAGPAHGHGAAGSGSRLRGNDEWAPPRRQIVFNVHPKRLSKKAAIAEQKHRCAGCGLTVELNYVKRFRYCEYLGKYFCPSCHNNDTSVIPARVLRSWDFHAYPVSRFAFNLLSSIAHEAVFDVSAINGGQLFKKSRSMAKARSARIRLGMLRDYLRTCRSGAGLLVRLDELPHLATEPNLYSLEDLIRIRSGELLTHMAQLESDCVAHVRDCPLCTAKAYICEICNNGRDLLFPFETQRVTRCPVCKDVYHKSCFKTVAACPKCERIRKYRERKEAAAAAATPAATAAGPAV